MITAIDFGSSTIRVAFRSPGQGERLSLVVERSGYTLVPDTSNHRMTLDHLGVCYASCDGALLVAGNQAATLQWLSRIPIAPLLADTTDGSEDPPARQMLSILVEAMLPRGRDAGDVCAVVMPQQGKCVESIERQRKLLSRLVRTQGYQFYPVNAAEAALLSAAGKNSFTGCSIVMGAEYTEMCVARYGVPLTFRSLQCGGNWIDRETARQFRMHTWDGDGTCYLDTETVSVWKKGAEIDLRNPVGDREMALSRLHGALIDQVLLLVGQMVEDAEVRRELAGQKLPLILSGGAAKANGLIELVQDRLASSSLMDRVLCVQVAEEPENCVVRGAMISADIASRSSRNFAA
jgi:hypothetical protein